MRKRKKAQGEGAASELEEALVGRLRELDWPKPTREVKRRCLDDILERMAEIKKEEPHKATRLEARGRGRGLGDRHSLTRRVSVLSHREPLRAPQRSVRVATVLW